MYDAEFYITRKTAPAKADLCIQRYMTKMKGRKTLIRMKSGGENL